MMNTRTHKHTFLHLYACGTPRVHHKVPALFSCLTSSTTHRSAGCLLNVDVFKVINLDFGNPSTSPSSSGRDDDGPEFSGRSSLALCGDGLWRV